MDKLFDNMENHPIVTMSLVLIANLVLLGLAVVVIVGALKLTGVL